MAVVYLAQDGELQREVAIKVLRPTAGRDSTLRKRFLREARLAAGLSHPNVVRIYDAGETDDGLFIVMEYVAGRTLADFGKLPANEAVPLAIQACAGLQHAHDAGLVHRDVKPANLLVGDDDVLKIADFGIARAAEATRLTELGTVLGTAAYLSPEQAAGEEVSAAADLYALGAVLYELLTGRMPLEFGSLSEVAAKHRQALIVPVRDLEPSVPEPLESTVMQCLARDPRFRPRSAAELSQELAGSSDVPAATPRTMRIEPSDSRRSKRARLKRLWPVPAAVIAVAVAAAVVGILRLGGGTEASAPPRPRPVAPPARGATPQQEARNLSAWLRKHAG
jgi:eukaryotic-like serine/threonine-protein kinase